jgi:hypothetical protein
MKTKMAKTRGKRSVVRYIVDSQGKKMEAVLPVDLYENLVERIDELEDIRDFDKAMKDPDFIPWEEAKKKLGL